VISIDQRISVISLIDQEWNPHMEVPRRAVVEDLWPRFDLLDFN
jgi:hypothetical protein